MFFVLFYDVHKENMFTINLEEASNNKNQPAFQRKQCRSSFKNNRLRSEINFQLT